MRNEKIWFCITTALAAALALTGCNGANSPTAPSPNSTSAPTNHSGVETSVMNAYVPEKKSLPLASCNLEDVDGVTFSSESTKRAVGQAHSFSGWVAAPGLDKPVYWLRFDDKQANRFFQTRINPSIERPDIVAIAGNEAFSPHSGFKVGISANALPAGQYHVYLAAAAGGTYSCDNGRQVLLGN